MRTFSLRFSLPALCPAGQVDGGAGASTKSISVRCSSPPALRRRLNQCESPVRVIPRRVTAAPSGITARSRCRLPGASAGACWRGYARAGSVFRVLVGAVGADSLHGIGELEGPHAVGGIAHVHSHQVGPVVPLAAVTVIFAADVGAAVHDAVCHAAEHGGAAVRSSS